MHSDKNYTASFLYFNVNDNQIATEASLLSLSIWFTIFHGNVMTDSFVFYWKNSGNLFLNSFTDAFYSFNEKWNIVLYLTIYDNEWVQHVRDIKHIVKNPLEICHHLATKIQMNFRKLTFTTYYCRNITGPWEV